MKKEVISVLKGQTYAPPRAESIEMRNEGLLCASPTQMEGDIEDVEGMDEVNGTWG